MFDADVLEPTNFICLVVLYAESTALHRYLR
jgi:hypothetical protein